MKKEDEVANESENENEEEEEDDDDEDCQICNTHGTLLLCDGETTSEDGCKLAVHPGCYKTNFTIPKGDFFCDRCDAKETLEKANVICCAAKNDYAIRRTMPIAGLPDPSFVHVLCAIWNPEIGLGKQDEHIKVEKFMLYLNHPCSFCSEKTGLRVKCSKSGCVHRFHISCAIKGGSLVPNRKKSAKTAPTALICGNHGKLSGGTSSREAESPSAGTQRPSSASSIMRPFSSGSKGDLKDWEAAREEKRRLAAAAETSGAPTNSKRRVLDSDEASSDVDQPAEKKQKRAESASVTKGKRAKQTISSDYEEEEEDMEEGAAGEEKGRDANESSEDESNINKSNNNQSSKNFKSASNGKNNHTGNSSTLAADIFGKDALQTRKLTSSQPQSNQTRRISETNTNRSKGLPPGLMKQRDMSNSSSIGGPEPTVETFKAIIRAQDKVCQDLKGFLPTFNRLIPTKQASQSSIAIPNTTQPPLQSQPQSQTQPPSNQAQPPQQQVSALDALLNKAHETSELNALKRELESYKSKLALKDTALVSLRANLCLIFNQLKLSAVTPDESSVDEYVSMLRDLLKN